MPDWADCLHDMLDAIRRILIYSADCSPHRLLEEPMRGDAILYRLTILGEAAKRIPGDVRQRHPEIPWSEAARLRDKIAHHYFGLDVELVVSVVRDELPALLPALRAVLAEEGRRPGLPED